MGDLSEPRDRVGLAESGGWPAKGHLDKNAGPSSQSASCDADLLLRYAVRTSGTAATSSGRAPRRYTTGVIPQSISPIGRYGRCSRATRNISLSDFRLIAVRADSFFPPLFSSSFLNSAW